MPWPWKKDEGATSSGFIWGMKADEKLLKAAEKEGRKAGKHHPPKDYEWPSYLQTLLEEVQAQTESHADQFAAEFAVLRQTAENCLESPNDKDKPALKQAIHSMIDLLEGFDRDLIQSHRIRQGAQSRYEKGMTDVLGYDSWKAPATELVDPIAGQRKQLQRFAARANRKINPSTSSSYTPDDDPFPEPNKICDWERIPAALKRTKDGNPTESVTKRGVGETHD